VSVPVARATYCLTRMRTTPDCFAPQEQVQNDRIIPFCELRPMHHSLIRESVGVYEGDRYGYATIYARRPVRGPRLTSWKVETPTKGW
jgi:hypothetical protein